MESPIKTLLTSTFAYSRGLKQYKDNVSFYEPLVSDAISLVSEAFSVVGVKVGYAYDPRDGRRYPPTLFSVPLSQIGEFAFKEINTNYALMLNLQSITEIVNNFSLSNIKIINGTTGEEKSISAAKLRETYGNLEISATPTGSYYLSSPFKCFLSLESSGPRSLRLPSPEGNEISAYLEIISKLGGARWYIPIGQNNTNFSASDNVDIFYINSYKGISTNWNPAGFYSIYNTFAQTDFKNKISFYIGSSKYEGWMYDREKVETLLKSLNILNIVTTEEEAINKQDFPFYPEPSLTPAEIAEKTQPGQEENGIINISGSGDRENDIIENTMNPFGTSGSFNSVYLMNFKQMFKLQGEIWKPDFLKSLESLTNAPQNALISTLMFPFDLISEKSGYTLQNQITLGTYEILYDETEFGEIGKATPLYQLKLEVGEYTLEGYYGGFLDYTPYTKISVYFPYVGIQELDPAKIVGKKLHFYYLVSVESGACKACIDIDDALIYQFPGKCGFSVSMSTSSWGEIQNSLTLGSIGNSINLASGIISGNSFQTAQSAGGLISTVKDTLGSFTANSTSSEESIERMQPQEIYLIIERPETAVPSNYNENYGRPSNITITMNQLKGYTEIPNPIFESTATETEKIEIIELLKNGIIIK